MDSMERTDTLTTHHAVDKSLATIANDSSSARNRAKSLLALGLVFVCLNGVSGPVVARAKSQLFRHADFGAIGQLCGHSTCRSKRPVQGAV